MKFTSKTEVTRQADLIRLLKNTGFDPSATILDDRITVDASKVTTSGLIDLTIGVSRPNVRVRYVGWGRNNTTGKTYFLKDLKAIETFIKSQAV